MWTWIHDAGNDVRLGVRGFWRERAFSASVIATLALGIGVNAAMFGVVDRLLLRGPEHVRDSERVRRLNIGAAAAAWTPAAAVGWDTYVQTLRRQGMSFEAVAHRAWRDAWFLGVDI